MKETFLKKICFSMCGVLIFCSLAIVEYKLNQSYPVRADEDTEAASGADSESVESVFGEKINELLTKQTTDKNEERPLAVVAGEIEPIPRHITDYYYDINMTNAQQDTVFSYCSRYDVPADLVFAIILVESGCDANAVSDSGEYGIMQINGINRGWLKENLGITDFLDFEQNVHCGVYMLSEYYHKYADINQIAMCYNLGENGAIERWEKGITSTDYTQSVVCALASLKKR